MIIQYINSKNGKLFSFHRHDYKTDGEVFIDGGFDYTRTNTEVHEDQIENLIGDIRNQFEWTANYNKDGTLRKEPEKRLLKDLDTDHIIQILIYFTERIPEKLNASLQTRQWKSYHLIFLNELKYRHGTINMGIS